MAKLEQAEWWAIRPARNNKPASYRCPLCGYQLYAMSEHMLIAPENDAERRRHAHSECVQTALRDGRIRSYEQWRKEQPRGPGLLERMRGALGRR
jgi:hypothetical protein